MVERLAQDHYMEAHMKFLVIGATGNVGSQVVRELQARKQQVRALTRDPSKAQHLGDVEVVKGDLLDPDTVRNIFNGVDGAIVINALTPSKANEGIMAVSGARNAGVKRLVYLSVQHADRVAYLPHFGCKVGVEAAVKVSGADWTILRPSNFHQNDQMFRDVILQHGVYPQPLGSAGVSRVDIRDIAELAAKALVDGGHAGQTYDLVGPRPVTGEECAAVWSKAIGRTVRYGGDDLDAWSKQSLQYMPSWLVYDVGMMFGHFQKYGLKATEAEVARITKALGHAPRSYEDYVNETAKMWSEVGATR